MKQGKRSSVKGLFFLLLLFSVVLFSADAQAGSGDSSAETTTATAFESVLQADSVAATVDPAAAVRVAVPQGSWWTSSVVDYLNTLPNVSASAVSSNPSLETLQNYNALVVYGNVYADGDVVLQWLAGGGHLIATPWSLTNYFWPAIGFTTAEPALPANNPYYYQDWITDVYGGNPLNLSLLMPDHPMVAGVPFAPDSVGYERGSVAKAGATEIARWNDGYNSTAIACWEYGGGEVFYLNMHYITSDCNLAISYDWGKSLIAYAVQNPCEGVLNVAVDIKPGSCPNPINTASRGVVPVAVLGTADFDVTTIDETTIQMEGVAPLRTAIEDVTTPVSAQNECECNAAGPDGYPDLTVKFDSQQIAAALGAVSDGQQVILTLTGKLKNGRPIEGKDCSIVLVKGR